MGSGCTVHVHWTTTVHRTRNKERRASRFSSTGTVGVLTHTHIHIDIREYRTVGDDTDRMEIEKHTHTLTHTRYGYGKVGPISGAGGQAGR